MTVSHQSLSHCPRRPRRIGLGTAGLIGVLLLGAAPQAGAQNVRILAPENETLERSAVFQLGFGVTIPLAHLSATDDAMVMNASGDITHIGDGYARSGTNLCLRVYIPLTKKIDLAADLTLPRFKLDQTEFRRDSSIHITNPDYYGRALGLGARYIVLNRNWGRAFLLATGGMYQLNLERFLSGPEVKTLGAYHPGASIGAGVEYTVWLLATDFTLRYHRYTDYDHFGAGDLAWLEISLQVSFDLDGK